MVRTKRKSEKQPKDELKQISSELSQRDWAVIKDGKVCFVNAIYAEALDFSSDGDSMIVTKAVAECLGISNETIFVNGDSC